MIRLSYGMARKLRIQFPGAIHHAMHRGDRRESIYADDQDRRRSLETLAETCPKTAWPAHTRCLIANHFHLRTKSTIPLTWIAQRLTMGSRRHLAWRFGQPSTRRSTPAINQALLTS